MPSPNPEQIETTREVLALTSYSDTQTRIEDLEDAQWTVQLAENTLWVAKRDKFIGIDGGKFAIKLNPESPLGRIRTRSQLRFGLPPTNEYGAELGGCGQGTTSVPVEIVF